MPRFDTVAIREREDLSPVLDILMLNDDDMRYLSFVNFLPKIVDVFGAPVKAQKYEWQDDQAQPETVLSGTSGAGTLWDNVATVASLPVNAGQINRLRVGDVLQLPLPATNLAEQVIVKSINTVANTIDVYARGHGGTTATAQGTGALSMKLIGNAQSEVSDAIDPSQIPPTDAYNYTQIFEDVADVSGTLRRSFTVMGDLHDYAVVKKLKEKTRQLNYSLAQGRRNLDITNKVSTMGGMRQLFSNTYAVGGALTLAKLYSALETHLNAGLFPHQIHGSIRAISSIEQLFPGVVQKMIDETTMGLTVSQVNIMGYQIKLYPDRHISSDEFYIVDRNRVAYGPLAGGEYEDGNFAIYPLYDRRHGKRFASQILGEFTCRVSNGGGTRATGLV